MPEITGVYSNTQILRDLESGNIVIDPFIPEHVNGTSVDVTLGYNFYRVDQDTGSPGIYNPYDKDDVARYFGESLVAQPLNELGYLKKKLGTNALKGIPGEQPVIILRPGERILGHTHEYIGIKHGTSSMQARSTTGRNGVAVCFDAGWGDPGFIGRWTMEILNLNEREHIPLPVGVRIAQVVFFHTGIVKGEYSSLSGKYQTESSDNLAGIKSNWKPSHMLPQAYRDVILPPIPIKGQSAGIQ